MVVKYDPPKLCPVPNCTVTQLTAQGMGMHLRMHRRQGDPGTPPLSAEAQQRRARKAALKAPKLRPGVTVAVKTPKLEPDDVILATLQLLFPRGISTDIVLSVQQWIEDTRELVRLASKK